MAFSFNKLNYEKWLMVNLKKNRLPKNHIVDRYMETTRLFDVKNDLKGLDFFIKEEDKILRASLPEKFQKGFAVMVLGAKHDTKKLPFQKLAELLKLIKSPVILLGGEDEIPLATALEKNCNTLLLSMCGKYNLNQSASVIEQAKLVITHDTGLMHIAAAFQKKIISIWGNTIPDFGMYPYFADEKSEIFEVKGLQCRPCSKIGFQKCPKKHFKCMQNQPVKEIAHKVNTLLSDVQ